MSVQNFKIVRVSILGLPLGNPDNLKKKCHLDVAPTKNHPVKYKEGNGTSSQRLSLLSLPHHLHLTYTNHPLSLVVHDQFILNSYL
jgi:hypothetical protein